jgi:hypothetical protein
MTSIESAPVSAVAIQRLLPLTAAAQIGLQWPCMHAHDHRVCMCTYIAVTVSTVAKTIVASVLCIASCTAVCFA